MPVRDPMYRDLDDDIRRDLAAQRETSPRAYELRRQLLDLYHRLPLDSPIGGLALKSCDYLSQVIADGLDVDMPHEANLRAGFRLGWPK